MYGTCSLCNAKTSVALCNFRKDGIWGTGSFKGCGSGFCADCGLVPAYSLVQENAGSYKDYASRVPLEIQEQNLDMLREKHGFDRVDDTCKIRYCRNCEDEFRSHMRN